MGSTPIRIRDEDRSQLDRLGSDLGATTGTRPSKQELLGKVVRFAVHHRAQFLSETGWKPLSTEEIRRWISLAEDLGPWTVDDIDEIVYGSDP